MFVRTSRVARGGKTYEYAQLVQSYRRPSDGMPQHRVLANLGSLSALELENLKLTLAASREGRRVVVATARASAAGPKPKANLRYLDLAVARELWRQWGLGELLADVLHSGDKTVKQEQVIEALVLQRLVAPASKFGAVRWFPRTALPELLGIAPPQFNNTRLHRALDELEAATPTLMDRLPRRYQERQGSFVSLFLDVTDTWFEGRGPKNAIWAKTKEGFVRRKIGIVLLCNERGLPLRWEVIPGNRADGPAMQAMMEAIAKLDWVGNAPVVVDRAMGHTANIRAMAATGLHFLTALTRPEFGSYGLTLSHAALDDLALHGLTGDSQADRKELAAEAARRIEAAGMQKVDDKLFVVDFGLVALPDEQAARASVGPTPGSGSEDINVRALQVCRYVRGAVAEGRSKTAAAAALGVSRAMLHKYERLLGLSEALQARVLDGAAAGRSLAALSRIARLRDPEAQRAAFETILDTPPPRPGLSAKPAAQQAERPEPVLVRVVAYFNPEAFVEQRETAALRLQRIRDVVDDLNAKLASPRSQRTRDGIHATLDRCLRRERLLGAYLVEVSEHDIGGATYFKVSATLDEEEWRRRRAYDGFSVLVGHNALKQPAAALCPLYRTRDVVEKDIQSVKGVVQLRPIRHQLELKVRAHVTLCMLALLIERTLHNKLAGHRSAKSAIEALAPCCLNLYGHPDEKQAYVITALTPEQRALLRKLRMLHLGDDSQIAQQITPR